MKSTFSCNSRPAKRHFPNTSSACSQMREDIDFSATPPIVREQSAGRVNGAAMLSNKYLLAAVLAAAALAMYASVFMKVSGE